MDCGSVIFPTAGSAPRLEGVEWIVEAGTSVDCGSASFRTADPFSRSGVVELVVGSPAKVSELVVMATGFNPLFCCRLSLSAFSSLKNFSLSTRRG